MVYFLVSLWPRPYGPAQMSYLRIREACGLPESTQHISYRVRMRAPCPWLPLVDAFCSGLSLWMFPRVTRVAVASGLQLLPCPFSVIGPPSPIQFFGTKQRPQIHWNSFLLHFQVPGCLACARFGLRTCFSRDRVG